MGVESYQRDSLWPVARSAIRATWPMRPGKEGFANRTLQEWLPAPEVLTKASPDNCDSPGLYEVGLKVKNYDLLSDTLESKVGLRIASGPTAQKCYGTDYSRTLELSSHAQRTNNYIHKNPESCSAPNHDLILDFYKN